MIGTRVIASINPMQAMGGCVGPLVRPPSIDGFTIELVEGEQPQAPAGACWASDLTPLIIETVTEQSLSVPEKLDAVGNVLTPAVYSTNTRQRIVQERREVWFRAPCPEELTIAYHATLQRALKARGLYLGPVTGAMDAPTMEAIRRFQADRGLDSPVLSLAAARELGLAATALQDL
jgi:Putative peptidoglycan binding domain